MGLKVECNISLWFISATYPYSAKKNSANHSTVLIKKGIVNHYKQQQTN